MKYFLCVSLLFSLYASEATDISNNSTKKTLQMSDNVTLNAKNYNGVFVGGGVNFGVQRTKVNVNREFANVPVSSRTSVFGVSGMIGYEQNVGGNFSIGVELGADFGKNAKQTPIGGQFRNNSSVMLSAHYRQRTILHQMFDNIANTLNTQYIMPDDGYGPYPLHQNVYRDFVRSIRYLGGTNNFLNDGGAAFMTSAARHGGYLNYYGGFWDNRNGTSYADSVFADAIGNTTLTNIRELGNGSYVDGYNAIRGFLHNNFPTITRAFGHMAVNTITIAEENAVMGPYVTAQGVVQGGSNGIIDNNSNSINWLVARQLRELFVDGNVAPNNIGVEDILPADRVNFRENLIAEVDEIRNFDIADEIQAQLDEHARAVLQSLKPKANYGLCPYITLKFGYFLNELNSQVYVKIGATQLQGYVVAANDFISVKNKFSVTAPLIAVGINKRLNEKAGFSVELAHAFKRNKKFDDIKYYGQQIENKVGLSKTTLRVMITYQL